MISARMTRRQLLQTSLLGGAFLGAASGLATIMAPWSRTPAPERDYLLLQPADLAALRALIPVVLGSRLPEPDEPRAELIEQTLASADALLFHSSPEIHRQVRQVLDLLSFPPYRVLLVGIARPWPEASEAEIRDFLHRWANSPLQQVQNIINAVIRVIQGAWYALPHGSESTGYPGPPASARVLVKD